MTKRFRVQVFLQIALVAPSLSAAVAAIAANVAWKPGLPVASRWDDPTSWAGGVKPANGDNVSFLVPTAGADGAILDVDAPPTGALASFRMANRDAKLTIKGKKLTVNTNDSEVSAGTLVLDGTNATATWKGDRSLKIRRHADQEQLAGQLLVIGAAEIDCGFENEGLVTFKATQVGPSGSTARLKEGFTNLAKRTNLSPEPTIVLHSIGLHYMEVQVGDVLAPGTVTNKGTLVFIGEEVGGQRRQQELRAVLVNDGKISVRKSSYASHIYGSMTTTHVNNGTISLESDVPKDNATSIHFNGLPAEPLRNNGRIEGCGAVGVLPQGKLKNKGNIDPKKIAIIEGLSVIELDPLDAAGGLIVNGDYEEESAATLAIDIATPDSAGETYDQLEISGEAILAGQLEVNLIGGYPFPAPADSFEIFRANGGRSGLFSNASSIVDAGAGTFDVVYTTTSVWLTNFQSSTAVEPMSWGEVKATFR
jgi:hypothetical protein